MFKECRDSASPFGPRNSIQRGFGPGERPEAACFKLQRPVTGSNSAG